MGHGLLRRIVGAALIALAAALPARAADEPGKTLPRFVSLRSDDVNARTGPGTQYPIEWRFTRRGMPVEMITQFGNWRKIRDWNGAEGWVHQGLVAARRSVVVTGIVRTMRRRPADDAAPVAQVEPGLIGRLLECDPGWCRIEAQGYRGWLKRNEFWGVYPNEKVE